METYNIVITTFNRLALLRECLACAFAQTVPAEQVIVVDNASTDGTEGYLRQAQKEYPLLQVVRMPENAGGAGGFSRGLGVSTQTEAAWSILIDDDAMLAPDYWEQLEEGIRRFSSVQAFAGVVKVGGQIDPGHRYRSIPFRRHGRWHRRFEAVPEQEYLDKAFMEVDGATFCGLVVSNAMARRIGLPLAEYFIWNDDMEYCMRIRQHSRIITVNGAALDHRTSLLAGSSSIGDSGKYVWKEYYRLRNRIDICRRYDGFLKMCKLCAVYLLTIPKMKKKLPQDQGSAVYRYNRRLIIDAVHDGLLRRFGKNGKYLPGA